MKSKKKRNLKVYNQTQGYYKNNVPTIILKGDWLKELGFDCNIPIEVICKKGKLIINTNSN